MNLTSYLQFNFYLSSIRNFYIFLLKLIINYQQIIFIYFQLWLVPFFLFNIWSTFLLGLLINDDSFTRNSLSSYPLLNSYIYLIILSRNFYIYLIIPLRNYYIHLITN